MKSVLISIQPKWCELIASGKKTIEVRKTKPKLETPFKVYIYCTKPRHYYKISRHLLTSDESLFLVNGKVRMCDGFGVEYEDSEYKHLNCKVIGEFVCDKLVWVVSHPSIFAGHDLLHKAAIESACLTTDEAEKYADGKDVYGWHISDLVIYDKPRELGEFILSSKIGCVNEGNCLGCKYLDCGNGFNVEDDCIANFNTDEYKPLRRPPQSWCYVESEVDTE